MFTLFPCFLVATQCLCRDQTLAMVSWQIYSLYLFYKIFAPSLLNRIYGFVFKSIFELKLSYCNTYTF